jgi:hypothetical protein
VDLQRCYEAEASIRGVATIIAGLDLGGGSGDLNRHRPVAGVTTSWIDVVPILTRGHRRRGREFLIEDDLIESSILVNRRKAAAGLDRAIRIDDTGYNRCHFKFPSNIAC